MHLEGELKLDGVRVRVVADIDLSSNEGTGRMIRLNQLEVAAMGD